MKILRNHIVPNIVLGLLLLGPLYLSMLLLLKLVAGIGHILQPIDMLLPESALHKALIAFVLVVMLSFFIGLVVRTSWGNVWREKLETGLLEKLPGYAVLRGFMRRVAGREEDSTWQPALISTDDDALMPAFVIEELVDGRYTVFVPSVPTPLAGAVFIYQRERVALVDIPFSEAVKMISHWGQGAAAWVAAAETCSTKSPIKG